MKKIYKYKKIKNNKILLKNQLKKIKKKIYKFKII